MNSEIEICPHCWHYESQTAGALQRHISNSRECKRKEDAWVASSALAPTLDHEGPLTRANPPPDSNRELNDIEVNEDPDTQDGGEEMEAPASPLGRPVVDLSAEDFAEDDLEFYPLYANETREPEPIKSTPGTPTPDDSNHVPDPTVPKPRPRRPTVEDIDEEEFATGARYVRDFPVPRKHPPAGTPLKRAHARTNFERIHREKHTVGEGPYAPFVSKEEWELARWAVRNLGHGQMNSLLELDHVSIRPAKGTNSLLTAIVFS
jgi:hypothetical protein